MPNLYFLVNLKKPRAAEVHELLSKEAARLGLKETAPNEAEIIVALGGDGTILHAVHAHPGKPVLGFNLGGLGYLSSVGERDFSRALALLAEGRYSLSTRTMLTVRRAGSITPAATALNDVVLVREMSGHAAIVDLSVDGRPATRYMADGLIFATPTGSTAYSLSAGGPVLMPDSAAFVITPMTPHALGIRPLVITDSSRFSAVPRERLNGGAEKLGVYADGTYLFPLGIGEAAEVAKSPLSAQLIELEGYDPYDVLARKLGWSGPAAK